MLPNFSGISSATIALGWPIAEAVIQKFSWLVDS